MEAAAVEQPAAQASRAPRRRTVARVGLAIGQDSLAAVEIRRTLRGLRPGRTWTWPLAPSTSAGGATALADALAALRGSIDAARVVASVALLHPLAQVKAVAVPPLRRGPLRSLISRNPRRYFVTEGDTLVVDALPLRGRTGAPSGVATVVCAPEALVESSLAAVAAAGFEVDRATAGAVALREAVVTLEPTASRGRIVLVVCRDEWPEMILLDHGALRLAHPAAGPARGHALARRIADGVTRMVAAGLRPERAIVLGDDETRADGVEALSLYSAMAADDSAGPLRPEPWPRADGPSALAAFGSALVGDRSPLLLGGALRTARRDAARRRTLGTSLAMVGVLGLAGALHLHGLRRELGAVEARRAAIAPALAEALTQRRAVETTRTTLATIAGLEGTAPHWTDALVALAAVLPDSAYLVSVSADGERLRITGAAPSAGAVVPSLEASPFFSRVTLSAPLRRDDGDELEHFELTTVLSLGTRDAGRGR
jgi:Tfp pilus assembly protein PilN